MGGDTARPADPNWPKKRGVRYNVPSCRVLSGGAVREGSSSQLGSAWDIGELLRAFCCLLCIFSLSVWLLVLFALFAVLLNCLYPNPWVLPFSFHSPPHLSRGKGDRATVLPFVAIWSQTTTTSTVGEPSFDLWHYRVRAAWKKRWG